MRRCFITTGDTTASPAANSGPTPAASAGIVLEIRKAHGAALFSVRRQERADERARVGEVDLPHLIPLEPLERGDLEDLRLVAIVREEEAGRVHAELSHDAQDQRVQEIVQIERGVELMREPHQGLQAVDLEPQLFVPRDQVLAVSRDLALQLLVLGREVLRPVEALEDPPHLDQKLLRRERLGQIVVRAVHEPLEPRIDLGARRDHDDRDVLRILAALDRGADLEARLPRQAQIEDHEIGGILPHLFEPLLPGSRDRHLEPVLRERDLEQLEHAAIVVDHEDASLRLRSSRLGRRAGALEAHGWLSMGMAPGPPGSKPASTPSVDGTFDDDAFGR
jgi:hypothetical protein